MATREEKYLRRMKALGYEQTSIDLPEPLRSAQMLGSSEDARGDSTSRRTASERPEEQQRRWAVMGGSNESGRRLGGDG